VDRILEALVPLSLSASTRTSIKAVALSCIACIAKSYKDNLLKFFSRGMTDMVMHLMYFQKKVVHLILL
jgi:hypothetical protein